MNLVFLIPENLLLVTHIFYEKYLSLDLEILKQLFHHEALTWEGAFNEVFKQQQVAVLQFSFYMDFSQQRVATAKLAL